MTWTARSLRHPMRCFRSERELTAALGPVQTQRTPCRYLDRIRARYAYMYILHTSTHCLYRPCRVYHTAVWLLARWSLTGLQHLRVSIASHLHDAALRGHGARRRVQQRRVARWHHPRRRRRRLRHQQSAGRLLRRRRRRRPLRCGVAALGEQLTLAAHLVRHKRAVTSTITDTAHVLSDGQSGCEQSSEYDPLSGGRYERSE